MDQVLNLSDYRMSDSQKLSVVQLCLWENDEKFSLFLNSLCCTFACIGPILCGTGLQNLWRDGRENRCVRVWRTSVNGGIVCMSVCLCVHGTVYAVVEAGFNIMYFPVEKGGWGICFKRYLLVRPRLRKIRHIGSNAKCRYLKNLRPPPLLWPHTPPPPPLRTINVNTVYLFKQGEGGGES